MRKILCSMALTLASCQVIAASHHAYVGVGSVGAKAGYAYSLNSKFNIRGEINALMFNGTFETSTIDYDGKVRFNNVSFFVDYYPFESNGLYLSAGLFAGKNKILLDAVGKEGTLLMNRSFYYLATGDRLSGRVELPNVRPYVGVGYGLSPNSAKGWNFLANAGFAYGDPKVSLWSNEALQAKVPESDLKVETKDVYSKIRFLRFYPIINIGFSYTF